MQNNVRGVQLSFGAVIISSLFSFCTRMFRAALFIIAQNWEQPTCLSVGNWAGILRCVHMLGQFSEIKRNKLVVHAATWMILKNTLKCLIQRVHFVWFRLYEILEQTVMEKGQNSLCLWMGIEVDLEEAWRNFLGWWWSACWL